MKNKFTQKLIAIASYIKRVILIPVKEDAQQMAKTLLEIPPERKCSYIVLTVLGVSAVFALKFIVTAIFPYLGIAALAAVGYKGYRWYTAPLPMPKATFCQDIEPVRDCCYNMISNLSSEFNWKVPTSKLTIDSVAPAALDNIERYHFRAIKKETEDIDRLNEEDVRACMNEELNEQFKKYQPYFVSELSGLYLDVWEDYKNQTKMAVIPINPSTADYIKRKELLLTLRYEKSMDSFEIPVIDIFSASEGLPHPFYKKRVSSNSRFFTPVAQDMDVYPHIACIGATGSGKTFGIKEISGSILIAYPDCQLYLGDYKGQDYDFLSGCRRYFPHDSYGDSLQQFQERLEARIKGIDTTDNRCLLVLDEWNNYYNSLPTSKEQNAAIKKLSFCLNMGRSYKMHILIGSQTGHAEFFGKSRDSICTVLGLGQWSKESKLMFCPQDYDKIKPQPRGCGYLIQDGCSPQEVFIPQVKDMPRLEKLLIERADI